MARPRRRTAYRHSEEFEATAVREGQIVTTGVKIEKDVAAGLKELRRIKKAYERLQVEHDLSKKAIEFTSERKATSSPSSSVTKKPTRRG